MATTTPTRLVAATVRERLQRSGERLWRFEDFADLPFPAVAQTLSRLARAGEVERLKNLMRVRPQPLLPRRPPIRPTTFPGITVSLGRPDR